MFYFLDTTSQIKRISKNVNLFENDERRRMSENTEILRDITDGLLYK
jgi:hypothetical protein